VVSRESPGAESGAQASVSGEEVVVTAYRPQGNSPEPQVITPEPQVRTQKPQPAASQPQVVAPKPQAATSGAAYYTVRRGDTLYSIAWRLGVDHRDLAAWNDIRPPYTIYSGQRIRVIPGQRKRVVISQPKPVDPAPKVTETTPKSGATKPAQVAATPEPKSKPKAVWKEIPSVKLRWQWPTQGKVVQNFSSKDINRKGIKIAGNLGQKITASEAGKVVYVGDGLIGYGQLIIIKHNKEYLSAYGFNRKLLVKEGDEMRKGDLIAEMGDGGSGRAQLHFEVRRNGVPVNPTALLPRR
jgi:lipoprotein NlpD